ncbi:MAG: NADPH:quinone oxidoreductase family protein [Burkholderiaceae bacterium]
MKAVLVERFAPFDQASVADLPDPQAAAGQVVVTIAAVEANYPDLLVMEGNYQIKPPLPFSPGKAAAGVITQIGEAVTDLKVGDRVAVQVEYGSYAEQLCCYATNCYPMPAELPFDEAAALGLVYQTAHFALVSRARIQPGETVLVLGASGGVGVAAVQLAKAFGARTVIAGVLGSDNADIARLAGADHTIELGAVDLRDELRDQVASFTDGHGVDVVIDPVGGMANAAALRAMAWCARMVIIGFASGQIPSIKANYLLVKNIEVSGLQWSDYRERNPQAVALVQQALFDLWLLGKIKPIISHRFALADYAKALSLLEQGRAQGKIILLPS